MAQRLVARKLGVSGCCNLVGDQLHAGHMMCGSSYGRVDAGTPKLKIDVYRLLATGPRNGVANLGLLVHARLHNRARADRLLPNLRKTCWHLLVILSNFS